MLVVVAKHTFKEKHGRKRTLSRFDRVHLKIVGLGSGSVVLDVNPDTTQPVLEGVPIPNYEFFYKAADKIIRVIESATKNPERLDDCIPAQYLKYFNNIGRNLIDEEMMELTIKGRHSAHLTQKTRKILARHSVDDIMQNITIRGKISDVDKKNKKFRLEPIHGTNNVYCSLFAQHESVVIDALDNYNKDIDHDKIRVIVRGTGIYDIQNNLKKINIRTVEFLSSLDVSARLDEFRNLQDGWLEGGGKAPDFEGLDWLSETFETQYPDDLPTPRTYPTADGRVSFEWSFGVCEIEMEVDIKNHYGEWCVFNNDTMCNEMEEKLELDDPASWQHISRHIKDRVNVVEND